VNPTVSTKRLTGRQDKDPSLSFLPLLIFGGGSWQSVAATVDSRGGGALGMIRIAVVVVLISGAGFYLIRGVVGVPRYFAWLNRRDKRGSA